MNGNSIQPTVELATTNGGNGFYPYPVMPAYGNYGYGNNGGFFGNDGIWGIILLALLFNNGWGGFNGNNGWNNVATTDYVSSEFTQRDINNGFQNTNNLISNGFQNQANQMSNGFSNIAQDLCDVKTNVLTGNMGLSNQILDSKFANQIGQCDIERSILTQTNELNTNLLRAELQGQNQLNTCCCDLKAQGLENTQRVIDIVRTESNDIKALITSNTIQDLRDKLSNAENIISNQSVINTLAPRSIPAYITSSPYQSLYNPYGWNGGFYGNGFYGNTIV